MELEYVARVVRRFWPAVLLSVVLGVALGLLVRPNSTPMYDSSALMIVVPNASSASGSVAGDRYISSQIVVLQSPPMDARANAIADLGMSDETLSRLVKFAQIPGTDVVRITATLDSPERAQTVANAYLDAYQDLVQSTAESDVDRNPGKIDNSIAEIEAQFVDIDRRIADALTQYYANNPGLTEQVAPEQAAPAIAAEREVLLEKYRDLLRRRTTLDFEPADSISDQIIQRAELPEVPNPQSSRKFILAVPFAMLLLGVAVATMLARSSRKVLDGTEVTEVLKVPITAIIPQVNPPRDGFVAHFEEAPDELTDIVNEVCVQAEAQSSSRPTLTVLVTGTQRESGTSTLAVAIAARFGDLGSKVLLIDLDFEHPDISERFGVVGDGIRALLGLDVEERTARHATKPSAAFTYVRVVPDPAPKLVSTPMANVSVVGREPGLGAVRPLRADILSAFEAAMLRADVVVIDAGPMLVASASAVLSHHVDAVVLAVPVKQQERASLRVASRQLTSVRSHLLPVLMPRLGRARPWSRPAPTVLDIEAEAADELLAGASRG